MGHHDAKPPPKTMPLHLAPRLDAAAEPMLIVVEGLEPGRRFALLPDATTIGRGPENHVVLPSPAVSNEHARIVARDGQFWIEDRASTNGVAVNGSRVAVDEPRVLANGDAIRVSDHLLFFHRGTSRQQDHGADIEIDHESAAARADELIEQLRREAPPRPPA
jgi:pSer/pThr/pTyr-binding forkhead associated (FHA) protein